MNLHAFARSFSSPMTRKTSKKGTEIFDKNVKATLSLHSPCLLRILIKTALQFSTNHSVAQCVAMGFDPGHCTIGINLGNNEKE